MRFPGDGAVFFVVFPLGDFDRGGSLGYGSPVDCLVVQAHLIEARCVEQGDITSNSSGPAHR